MEMAYEAAGTVRGGQTGAAREFDEMFARLRKKYELWMHLRSSVYEREYDRIEIWRFEGGKKIDICNVKREDIEECYEIAILDLKFFEEKMQRKEQREAGDGRI